MSVLNNQVDGARPAPERPTSERATSERHASRSSASSHSSAEAPRKVSVLGKTLVFKGELAADEDIILQGRVEGSIHHTQSVTVGIDGVVIGDTHARTILVEGTVEGDIKGVVSVLIAATATVRGNISAPRVGIMEGANFNGSVDMQTAVGAVRGSEANPRMEVVAPSADTGLTGLSVERILGK